MSAQDALFTTTGHESQAAERITLERRHKEAAGYKERSTADMLRVGLLETLRELEWAMNDARDLIRTGDNDGAVKILTDAHAELTDAVALARDYAKEVRGA